MAEISHSVDGSAMMVLDEAILSARNTVQTLPYNGGNNVVHLNSFADLLEHKFQETRDRLVLEELIELSRRIVEITTAPTSDDRRATAYGRLSVCLGQRFSRLGQLSDLDEALDFSRQAVACSSEADKPAWLMNLSNRLAAKFFRVGLSEDLEEAVATSREAVKSTPVEDPNRAERQGNLACHLSAWYSFTGDMAYLEESLGLTCEAINGSRDHPSHAKWLHNYGIDLGKKYLATGAIDDLNQAVSFARQAVETIPENSPEHREWANSLSIQLRQRFTRIGAMVDITEAVTILESALQNTPGDDPYQIVLLHSLSNCLGQKYTRSGSKDDLQSAITFARRAKRATPKEHRDLPAILNTLSSLLGVRFARRGGLKTIEDAMNAAHKATELTEKGHPDRAKWLSTYGRHLACKAIRDSHVVSLSPHQVLTPGWRYTGQGATAMLERMSHECIDLAVSVTREAVESLPPEHSSVSVLNIDLANRLSERSSLTGQADDLQKACKCFLSALKSPRSSVRIRLSAGKQLLSTALDVYDTQAVYQIAQYVVELIPLLVPNSLRSADKQHLLTDIEGIASLAAAVALEAGQKALDAINILETGRAVLAGSLRDLRTDLVVLQENHSQLAQEFVDLRKTLDSTAYMDTVVSTEEGSRVSERFDQRLAAERRMAELIKQIRRQPGFDTFLRPVSELQMLQAASNGPIVIVNVSLLRCDALIVDKKGFRLLELPKLILKDIIDRKHDRESTETLEWLWDVLVDHILDDLGYKQIPVGEDPSAWPCIWWVPTGPLVLFPIHAAGYHFEMSRQRSALDRVVSSYSSSVKSMVHGRQQSVDAITSEHNSPKKMVLVSMEDTPGSLRYLRYAAQEVQVVDDQSRSMNLTTVWPSPFLQNVVSELAGCFIFHFAGHGDAKRSNPLDSSVLLKDWETNPLTVEKLIDMNLTSTPPFLAYLSACGTGQVRQEESLDEGIHLAGAFQLAGFRHVIGTLWDVDDELCVAVARKTYKYMADYGISDGSVRAALHHALRKLRHDWVQETENTTRRGGSENSLSADLDEWEGFDSDSSASSSTSAMSEDSEKSEYNSEDDRAELIILGPQRAARLPWRNEVSDEDEDGSWETESGESSLDDANPDIDEIVLQADTEEVQSVREEESTISEAKRDIGSVGFERIRRPRPRWVQYVHYGV